jgi:hypothetical protein
VSSDATGPVGERGPRGFRLLLPDDWIEIELDPDTAEASRRRIIDLLAGDDPRIAAARDRVEELLRAVRDSAADDGAELCALRFEIDSDGQPVQAVITVALRSVDGSTDPAAVLDMIDEVGGDTSEAASIKTASGTGLRIAEHTADRFLYLTALVPVPDIPGRLAVIQLLSPSLTHEDKLRGFFDGVVGTFAFTWEDGSE